MTLKTLGMGAVKFLKTKGKKLEKMIEKGVVDKNIKSKELFKILKDIKGKK